METASRVERLSSSLDLKAIPTVERDGNDIRNNEKTASIHIQKSINNLLAVEHSQNEKQLHALCRVDILGAVQIKQIGAVGVSPDGGRNGTENAKRHL